MRKSRNKGCLAERSNEVWSLLLALRQAVWKKRQVSLQGQKKSLAMKKKQKTKQIMGFDTAVPFLAPDSTSYDPGPHNTELVMCNDATGVQEKMVYCIKV